MHLSMAGVVNSVKVLSPTPKLPNTINLGVTFPLLQILCVDMKKFRATEFSLGGIETVNPYESTPS